MTRAIFCRKCGEPAANKPLPPEDRRAGWRIRYLYVAFDKPVICDLCSNSIEPGEIGLARTMWRPAVEFARPWEAEFGQELSPESVSVDNILSGEPKP